MKDITEISLIIMNTLDGDVRVVFVTVALGIGVNLNFTVRLLKVQPQSVIHESRFVKYNSEGITSKVY